MRFIAIGTAIDSLPVPPSEAIAAYAATFRRLAAGEDPRIVAAYPFVGERATALLIDADSAEELDEVLEGLPGFMLATWRVHPVTTAERVARSLERMEAALAGGPA